MDTVTSKIMKMTDQESLLKTKDKRNELLLRHWFNDKKVSTAGRIIWKGKSKLDPSADIAVVMSRIVEPSENIKTGRMIQIQILNYGKEYKDFNPMSESICGDCQHKNKSCYVLWNKSIYSSWKRAMELEELTLDQGIQLCKGRSIRLGTAGDPAAVPAKVWIKLLEGAKNWTAYTHQWHKPEFQEYKEFCMASVDSLEQERLAISLGWLPFRVGTEAMKMTTTELYKGLGFETQTMQCPATRFEKANCADCGLCSGLMVHKKNGAKLQRRNQKFKGIGVRLHGSSTDKYIEPPSIEDDRYEWARSEIR